MNIVNDTVQAVLLGNYIPRETRLNVQEDIQPSEFSFRSIYKFSVQANLVGRCYDSDLSKAKADAVHYFNDLFYGEAINKLRFILGLAIENDPNSDVVYELTKLIEELKC